MEARTPVQILEYISDISVAKANRNYISMFLLGILSGVFIAFSSHASIMASFNLLSEPHLFGLGRALSGAVFGVGLMLILITGSELFTGNMLLITGVLEKKIKLRQMLNNLIIVYIGNFVGGILIAYMIYKSELYNKGDGTLGSLVINLAVNKVSFSFLPAFYLGIMCNWLVCLAVWVSCASKDIIGKIIACFFIIGLFVISDFEHSIANMYFIPAGILAKENNILAEIAKSSGAQIHNLNWAAFFTKNLIPVTLGNMAGGLFMVGFVYWLTLKKLPDRKS